MSVPGNVIPEQLEGQYFDDPILPLPQNEPGILDLINPTGSGFLPASAPQTDVIGSKLDEFASSPASRDTLSAPVFFDYDAAQTDRYTQSPNFTALGFNPMAGVENEYKYGARQTWGDVWRNGLSGMFSLAGNTYVEGWKGWAHLTDAITSWDASKLVGTEEQLLEQDRVTKEILNKYAIYSTPESEEGIFNRKFFGDMLQQSGFAVGAIGQFLTEELLTWGLSTQFSLAKLGLRAPSWAGRVVSHADLADDLVKLGSPVWKAKSFSEGAVQAARQFVPLADTAYTMSRYGRAGAGAMQMAAIGVGGVRRFLSEANMAMTEARMEAAGTYGELYNKLYDEELRRTGQAPMGETLERIKQMSMDAASDNFGVNTGILMLSNRLQFDNLFSKFGTGRGFFGTAGEFADDVVKVTGRTAGKEAAEQTTKLYAKGRLGTLGLTGEIARDFGARTAAWEATKSLGRNIFKWETSEGLQELFQEGSNKGLSDYYYDLYHGKKGYDSRMQAVVENVEVPFMDIEGTKTFLMGALTGRLLSPINFTVGQIKKYAGTTPFDRLNREVKLKESVSLINAFYQNPERFLNEHIANVKIQDRAAKNMEEAIRNRDRYEFVNNKDGAFAKMMSAAMKTDMFKALTNTIREYGNAFNDEEFRQAFGLDKTEENINSVREYFNKIADETESFHKTWRKLKDKYGDTVMVDLYGEGTPERKMALMAKRALDDAIEMLATNSYRATRAADRAAKLQQEIGAIPQLGNSTAIGFRVLGVEGNAQKEAELLKNEIQNLEATATKDKATKELLKTKKSQLKAIENWLENAPALKEMGRKQKRKFNKAKTAFENYLNSQNQQAGIDVTVKSDEIQDIYDKLVDYMELNKDFKDYIDAYNILANPMQFVRVHQRLMEAMDDAGKRLEEEHKQEADNNIQGKPPVNPGKPSSSTPIGVHTVRPEADGTFTVVSPQGNVVFKGLATEEEAAARAKELDEILAEQGRKTGKERPEGIDESAKVLKYANNVYLIEEEDAEGEKFWYIVNQKGQPIVNVKLDKTTEAKYPDYSPESVIPSLEYANDIYDAIQRSINKEVKEFEFDGQNIKFGDILVDDKNRKYKVLTKGEAIVHQGKKKIVIQPLTGAISTYTIDSLKGYRLESQTPESMQPEDPNAFRLQRNNELVRVYAVRLPGENQDTANARLKTLIHQTPKDDLVEGISIRVTKNKDLGPVTKASFADGSGVNNRLQQNPEPYMVEIMYGGQTIGFATYYNRFSYINNEGNAIRLDNITKKEFVQIFNVDNKNVDVEYDRFKANFKTSLAFHTALTDKLKDQDSVTLSSEETAATFSFIPSAGEYAFATDKDARVSLNDVDYSTVDGFTYILDRRTRYLGDGMYEEDPRVQTDSLDADTIEERVNQARYVNGEDKLRNYGRYVAAVELPNGAIKFIELQSAPATREELDVMVDKINQKSRDLKENNLEVTTEKDKVKYSGRNPKAADDINSEISDNYYITVGGRRGMRVNLQVLPTGNIKVEFATFVKGSKKPEKREVHIKESEKDPTKPLQIKDAADLIERINNAVAAHDANPKNVVKKIGVGRFNLSNFKRSVPDNAAISEYRQMLAGTTKEVVRNEGLFFNVKSKELSPTSTTLVPNVKSVPKSEVPGDKELDGVQVPPHIAEAQAAFLKRRKQQMEEKSVQEQVQDLSDKRDQLIAEIEKENLASGMTRKEAMRFNYDADPRIAEINRQIAQLNGGAALKVSSNLSSENIVDINTFVNWVQRTLPEFISVEDLKVMRNRMKSEGITVGMFYTHMNELNKRIEGKIAVGKDSPFKYHEAFHAVFRMLLTDQKIDELYQIARKELLAQGKNIETLKKELMETKPALYRRLTDKQLEERVYEEYLADKFDAWKNDIKTPTSPVNKSVFRRILDFIKSFFKRIKTSPIDELFSAIDKGRFKNSSVVRNRFTSGSQIGISEPALKAIQIGTRVITNEDGEKEVIPVYLSQEEGDKLVATISAVYHSRMQRAGLSTHSEDVMDDILADYLNLYDRSTNPYYSSDEFLDRYEEGGALALDKAHKRIDNLAKIFRNPELRKVLKDAIRVHTNIMGYRSEIEGDLFDEAVDEYGDRVTTDNWKETYSIGGYGSLSKELRQYLATVVEETADEFGNTVFIKDDGTATEEPLVEAVNANVLYNGILKAVQGSTDQNQLLERLRLFAQYNPEARKFWNKFSADVDIQYDEEGDFVDIGNKQQANLFQAVVKGFQQFSVDYYFINKDLRQKETKIIEANRKGAAKNQFSIWYNAYLSLFADQFENVPRESQAIAAFIKKKTAALDKLAVVLKKGNKVSRDVLDTQLENMIVSLRNELGINLSPLYLKYSYLNSLDQNDLNDEDRRILKAFEGVDPMTEEDAREIASVIRAGKNPFGSNIDPDKLAESEEQMAMMAHEEKKEAPEYQEDEEEENEQVEDDVDGAVGRITKIAAANAVFDEQVATTSYKNAEGELVYSHQLPTYNLVRTAQLQSEEFRNNLKNDPYLSTNYLLNNPLFNYIADTLKIARIDGIKDSSLKKTETGALVEDKQLNVNQNTGVTYGSMSDREFLISLFELYANNKRHVIPATDGQPRKEFMTTSVLLGVLEASNTADVLNLPVVRAVEYVKGKIVLTKEAKTALLAEVKREYDRISRVQNEINNDFPNGVIDGYHTGDPNKGGMRGLKFIKSGNMLGKLADTLATGARNNANFDAYVTDVLEAIEKYWLGPGGQIDQMRDLMIDLSVVKRTKEDKLENNLLNKYLFSGFKNNEGKIDVERNSMLNILPSAVDHNLAQVVINNFINTLSARQLYIGDAAENYKDDGGIDEVKRNKGLNGSGPSIASIITAPQLGINHTNQKSHIVTVTDPMYDGKFAGKKKEKADAQMWMTTKALRYTLFGLGKLNAAQAELLDKIENGESVSVDDIFGEKYKDEEGRIRTRGGSIEYNAQTNSIKLVYNDGKKYIKTSGVILSKQLTAVRQGNNWVARPGYEELDALRVRLEEFESKNNTITMAIPKSASKGLKKNIAKDVFSIQDDNFIEHDNNFWRLQLENPSNKTTITDPTQAKQLIIAEQSRDLVVNFQGQEMTLGEVIDSYLKDTQQRIKNNYFSARDEMFDVEAAFQELGKSLKQSQITPKLGKFLQRAVETLSTTGADSQLLEFFQPQINPQTGELTPKYNLNHPITLDKFTQLFLAYYSKGVMSEKVPGHSVALMSNYGVKVVKRVIELDERGQPKRWEVITRRQYEKNRALLAEIKNAKRYNNELDRIFDGLSEGDYYIDDLRHNVPEYDENGNITGYFTEYMMPPHFREHMSQYNADGTISDSARKAFAVRIPSQDKHSFVTAKLVDFMPAFYGSTAVFPHELIEISGADFDIDKLYMQIYDSYRDGNRLVAYGTAKTAEDKFAEFVHYKVTRDKQFKNKVEELYGLKPDAQSPDLILGNLEPSLRYDDMAELTEDLFSSKKTIRQVIIQNALRELGLPTTPAEYMKLVNDGIELNNGVLNNRILEAKIKLLNNEKVVTSQQGETPIAFQVAEVQPLLDAIENFKERFPILYDILVETGSDVDSMIGQYRAYKNNKEGARNIGPAVNAMLVYAVMNAFKVKVREQNSKGEDLFVLTIDGNRYDSFENTMAFVNRSEVGPDGQVRQVGDYTGERIFYNISAIVSAMTDNAKERLAARLGLNINAVGVVSNMVALGVPLETALMFNLQPSVRDFYKKIAITGNNIKTKEELDIFKSKVGEAIRENLADKAGDDPQKYEVTTELLERNIKSNGDNAAVDLAIFSSFLEFYKQSEYYSSVAQILKLSKGLGTSNEDIDAIDQKEEMLGLNMSDIDFAESKIPFDLRQVLTGKNPYQPFHQITATYIKIKNQIKELQKSVFIEKTYLFQRLKETVLANLQVNRKEEERFNLTLKRDIIAYLGIKSYMQQLKTTGKQAKLAGLDNAMIYDEAAIERGEGFLDIVDTVKSIRQILPNNYFAKKFLNIIPTKIVDAASSKAFINPKSKAGINIAESNTWAKLNTFEQNRLEDSFLEIYADPKTRQLAYNLFNYLIVKDGGQFKSGSFIKFIPTAMFSELLDATEQAHELLKQDSLVSNDALYKDIFGMTSKDLFNEFTSLYSTNVNNTFNIPNIKKAGRLSSVVEENKPKNYVPEVMFFSKDKSRLSLDLFGGVRKPELTLLEDEYGNEFYAETIAAGKFSSDEMDKFNYNKEVIKAKGFKLINKPDEKGNNRYFIGLPLTIKVNHNPNVSDFPDMVYYRLVSTGKKKNKHQIVTKTAEIIKREELQKNPTIMYLFGDNDKRTGLGGQAKEMRGEPNAFGISTKKRPSNDPDAFKTDEELEENKKIITADVEKILTEWRTGKYTGVVIPPIGVGLAKLKEKAPETFAFLQQELKRMEKEINAFEPLTGVGTFIKEIGDTIALSNTAIYERFEPLGSRKQWKAGGVTGKLPEAVALRKRSGDNSKEFGIDTSRLESALDAIDSMLASANPVLYSEAARDLNYEWGISLGFVGNKLTYYKSVNGKQEVYKTEAESPEQLLEILRNTAPSAPAEDTNPNIMENVDKAVKKSTQTPNFDALGSINVDPEEAKKNLQKLLAAKKIKKEIDDRKKEDDKGCESPL